LIFKISPLIFILYFHLATSVVERSRNITRMKTDEFLSIMDNPNFISGIYNYCDRWCERCHMTDRCSLFATTPREEDLPTDDPEAYHKASWKAIEDAFAIAMDLLQKSAEARGIDLTTTEEEDQKYHEEQTALRERVSNEISSKRSMDYIKAGRAWLNASASLLKEKEEELIRFASMQLPGEQPAEDAATIREALDVVQYYLFQIHVKIQRALSGHMENDEWFEENDFPKDSDGSAKVALIGIDRSIGGWGILLHQFPSQEEPILNLLTTLERLRREVEEVFPDARGFKRPGFDL